MAKLLVIGASAGIGLETVKAALAAGHAVRAFARSADGIPGDDPELERFKGDALNSDDLRRALEGVDAVAMTLGVPINRKTLTKPATLFSKATRTLLPLMQEIGPRRLIVVTGFGAGDSRAAMSGLEKLGHDAFLGRIYPDKGVQEAAVKDSGLDWTIVRPGILMNGDRTGRYEVLTEPQDWRNGLIRRADVADFIVRCVEGAHVGQAPVIIR
jgi:uncharacterized protein YbjT (DUF2867 family)